MPAEFWPHFASWGISSGLFRARVSVEGLFVGLRLAFWRWRAASIAAALLVMFARWTRVGGAALVIPPAIPWFRDEEWMKFDVE